MTTTIDQLKRAIHLTEMIEKLQAGLNQIFAGFVSGDGPLPEPPKTKAAKSGRKKGKISAAGRAAIKAAQKARWAKIKGASAGPATAVALEAAASKSQKKTAAPKAKGKRTMSPEARAKMAAAAKKRWAKVKKAKAA